MSTQYDYKYIRESIQKHFCSFFFEYKGKKCGIDVNSPTDVFMWYGEKQYTATNMNDIFSVEFYDGKTLKQIFQNINIDLLE